MSELITDEAVEVATKAAWEAKTGQTVGPDWPSWIDLASRDRLRATARAALEAAAPLIAGRALRRFAETMTRLAGPDAPATTAFAQVMTEAADQIEREGRA